MLSHRTFRMHRIDAAFNDLSASSKINAEWALLEYLRDLGRTAVEDWLKESFDWVGRKSTLDLPEELQRKPERGAPPRMRARAPVLGEQGEVAGRIGATSRVHIPTRCGGS